MWEANGTRFSAQAVVGMTAVLPELEKSEMHEFASVTIVAAPTHVGETTGSWPVGASAHAAGSHSICRLLALKPYVRKLHRL